MPCYRLSILAGHAIEAGACLYNEQTLLLLLANFGVAFLSRTSHSFFFGFAKLSVSSVRRNSQAEENIPRARLLLSPSPSVAVFWVGSKLGAHPKNGGQRRGRAFPVFFWFVPLTLEPKGAGEGAVAFLSCVCQMLLLMGSIEGQRRVGARQWASMPLPTIRQHQTGDHCWIIRIASADKDGCWLPDFQDFLDDPVVPYRTLIALLPNWPSNRVLPEFGKPSEVNYPAFSFDFQSYPANTPLSRVLRKSGISPQKVKFNAAIIRQKCDQSADRHTEWPRP